MDIQHQWKTILVVIEDEADQQNLIKRVRLLATQLKAKVILFQACHNTALDKSYLFDKKAKENAQQGYVRSRAKQLKKLGAELQARGISVEIQAVWQKPLHDAVVAAVEASQADVVFKETRYHSMISRAVLTNTDWHLIRELKKPVWFVRSREWTARMTLAAAVDPMHLHARTDMLDERLLETAHELACYLPAELHVIHAYEPVPTGVMAEFDALAADYDAYRHKVREKHQEVLDALLKSRVEATAVLHVEEGAPERVLPSIVAAQNIDLLIMGGVSRSGLDRIFVGNVAESVLDRVESDVLVVR